MFHTLKATAGSRLSRNGIILLTCASVYPIYIGLTWRFHERVESLPLVAPLLIDCSSLKAPIKLTESGTYVLSVDASIKQNSQLVECLLNYSTDGCSKYGSPLSFHWTLTSPNKAVFYGTFGDREKYFSPFISETDIRNPLVGCEFAWIPKLESDNYTLELTDLHVPEKLKTAHPRLKMERHQAQYDFGWLGIFFGLSVSALLGSVGAIMLAIFFLRDRVRRKQI